MMLTPCWPSAGPTGGAGVALPASICSLTMALTFFATRPPEAIARNDIRERCPSALEDARDLQEVQLDRRLAAKEGDQHAHLALFGVDVVHQADEVRERS